MTFPVRTMIGPMPIVCETSRMTDVFPAGNSCWYDQHEAHSRRSSESDWITPVKWRVDWPYP
jgi:hypothetical protein